MVKIINVRVSNLSQLELKIYPDPCLRIKTKPVEKFTQNFKETLRTMAEIMYLNQGVGLAATQVGLGLSVLLIDIGEGLKTFVNPEIIERSRKRSRMEEGCLSLPGVTVSVSRPERIKLRAQDENGDYFINTWDGLYATALQHEFDHLQGKLTIDYLDPVRRFITVGKLSRSKKKVNGKTCEVICNVRKKHTKKSGRSS